MLPKRFTLLELGLMFSSYLHFCSLRFNMSVQLDLLHGGHVQNLDTFNQCPWRLLGIFWAEVQSTEPIVAGFFLLQIV